MSKNTDKNDDIELLLNSIIDRLKTLIITLTIGLFAIAWLLIFILWTK